MGDRPARNNAFSNRPAPGGPAAASLSAATNNSNNSSSRNIERADAGNRRRRCASASAQAGPAGNTPCLRLEGRMSLVDRYPTLQDFNAAFPQLRDVVLPETVDSDTGASFHKALRQVLPQDRYADLVRNDDPLDTLRGLEELRSRADRECSPPERKRRKTEKPEPDEEESRDAGSPARRGEGESSKRRMEEEEEHKAAAPPRKRIRLEAADEPKEAAGTRRCLPLHGNSICHFIMRREHGIAPPLVGIDRQLLAGTREDFAYLAILKGYDPGKLDYAGKIASCANRLKEQHEDLWENLSALFETRNGEVQAISKHFDSTRGMMAALRMLVVLESRSMGFFERLLQMECTLSFLRELPRNRNLQLPDTGGEVPYVSLLWSVTADVSRKVFVSVLKAADAASPALEGGKVESNIRQRLHQAVVRSLITLYETRDFSRARAVLHEEVDAFAPRLPKPDSAESDDDAEFVKSARKYRNDVWEQFDEACDLDRSDQPNASKTPKDELVESISYYYHIGGWQRRDKGAYATAIALDIIFNRTGLPQPHGTERL